MTLREFLQAVFDVALLLIFLDVCILGALLVYGDIQTVRKRRRK